MNLENQFDLNDCYIYCDQKAKEFAKIPPSAPVNLMEWNETFQKMVAMVNETKRTMDLCEAVMEPEELQKMYEYGLDEVVDSPTIPNQVIRCSIDFDTFKITFSTDDWIAEEISSVTESNVDGLTYQFGVSSTVDKHDNSVNLYQLEISGDLPLILDRGFQPLLETTLAPNVNYFMLEICKYGRENGLPLKMPTWFLIYEIKILLDKTRSSFDFDARVINAGAMKQMTKQKGPIADANIRQAREYLTNDLPKIAKYYENLIRLYCLENS